MGTSMDRVRRRLGAVLLTLGCGAAASAQTYQVTDLGSYRAGISASTALKISDRGEVLGVTEVSPTGGARRLFVLTPTGGPVSTLHLSSECWVDTRAKQGDGWGENRFQDTTGMLWWVALGEGQAHLWTSTSDTLIGVLPDGTISAGTDVNASRAVVGWSDTHDASGDVVYRGFYWTAAAGMQRLDPLPGQAHAQALGINDRGQVVGRSTIVPYGNTVLSRRPLTESTPQLLGSRAVIWKHEQPVDLNTLCPNSGWTLLTAGDINNLGQIVGCGINPQGKISAYRLDLTLQDFNADGVVDARDFATFMQDFSVQAQTADVTAEGEITLVDAVEFIQGPPAPQLDTEQQAFATSGVELALIYSTLRGAYSAEECLPGSEQQPDTNEWYNWRYSPGWPNVWSQRYNPDCLGCNGNNPDNPIKPSGQRGWPGAVPGGRPTDWPYPPGQGGPGGDGAPGTPTSLPGNGGRGGDGSEGGRGGNGGRGGDSNGPHDGGAGGDGGDGGPDTGAGGDGGRGGDNNSSGRGGAGGNGGNGGGNTSTKDGGNGGNGGLGGTAGPAGDGRGGSGGTGGKGGDGGPRGGNGGNGGTGAQGGKGGSSPTGGNQGGDGGRGGNGGNGQSGGSNGGNGGQGGAGGTPGTGGFGGGGGDGGLGGNGKAPGHGGTGGNGGAGTPAGGHGAGGTP